MAGIPMVDNLEGGFSQLRTGVHATVDGDAGELRLEEPADS